MKQVGKSPVKASTLEFPFDLYPRNHRDEEHVERLAAALAIGEALPHIVVEEATMRVVDGWHRVAAHQKAFGHDCEIEAEFWSYQNDGYFFLHATRLNTIHGLRLSRGDQKRCLVVAKNLDIRSEKVLRVLALTPEDAKRMMENDYTERARPVVPLKRELQYLGRRNLTKDQARAVGKLSGKGPAHHADQLVALMENGLMPEITKPLAAKLSRLKELLEERGY